MMACEDVYRLTKYSLGIVRGDSRATARTVATTTSLNTFFRPYYSSIVLVRLTPTRVYEPTSLVLKEAEEAREGADSTAL